MPIGYTDYSSTTPLGKAEGSLGPPADAEGTLSSVHKALYLAPFTLAIL